MHLLRTETRTLDEAEAAVDLAQSPAELVFLSFTDSDMTALARAWNVGRDGYPTLRIAPLAQLKHPYSVDLYVANVAAHARFVLVRLLGGLDYWRYGVEELSRAARAGGFELAVVPGDYRQDERLDAASTLPPEDLRRLWGWFHEGGPENLASCLAFLSSRIGAPHTWREPEPVPAMGVASALCREPATLDMGQRAPCGTLSREAGEGREGVAKRPHLAGRAPLASPPRALITFYRSVQMAADTAPIAALADALAERGFAVTAAYVSSLKDPAAASDLSALIARERPDVILNTTAFSGRAENGPGVLDEADAPVLQAILSGARAEAWRESGRGLGAADLAMNVVLPELDGRLIAGAISFKAEAARSEALEFASLVHRPDPSRVAAVADRAAAWARLRRMPAAERQIACVLSDYPHKGGRAGYAVGLDTPASVVAIVRALDEAGYAVGDAPDPRELMALLTGKGEGAASLTAAPLPVGEGGPFIASEPDLPEEAATSARIALSLRERGRGEGLKACAHPADAALLPLAAYERHFAALPASLRASITAAWGSPAADPAVANGAFSFRVVRCGTLLVALQPTRGLDRDRKADHHDPALPPRHAYVAFYLWLRLVARVDAMIHCGTHGTLEWLPGKAVALSADCAPEAVLGPVPVIYPFIVNNPGEAAQAKRRIAAVTVGHLTPPLVEAGQHGAAAEVEALLDEYADAQGLDPRRARKLADAILERAVDTGLAAEAGLAAGADPEERLQALDAWLCDLKEARIGDGLHVFGRSPERWDEAPADIVAACGPAEMAALLRALDGRFVEPGPAGAPSRGRSDVLPTGRNLFSVDPRSIPTRTAWEIGRRTADEIVTRYAQDHGDWPKRIVLDLWGSATMRTGGDEIAQAMALLGVRPVWDHTSSRVSGFEILPPAVFGRPRVDVTLCISGLFRDVFPGQIALFDDAVRAVAALDEPDDENPLAAASRAAAAEPMRIFGTAPGAYGLGLGEILADGQWADRAELGAAYLAASSHAYGRAAEGASAPAAFGERVASADAFVHVQDMAEQDVLDSDAFAEHEGGFAAAASSLGATPVLYHANTANPERTRVRTLAEEVAKVLRSRAANPRWLAGQMRHGWRGAAEIAETVGNLFAHAALAEVVRSEQFDLMFDASCGDDAVRAFLLGANPGAARAIADAFDEAQRRGFWSPRRNSTAAILAEMRSEGAAP
ncbi:cobaltochelatase subunit CobN [Alsobacter metallidurans]|uniref:Cobaltochelatase subunit CobN n=1 Tax=Alsobacter metallidurans TaxID=340221 RepID=A0A917MGD9_9HYPH|nr:cobaltochelatase subunit CobN [Alsobacter metallidurans]GGH10505.1 cobaltochelatase subunit CobN [Alsobacter metallidurans]